MRVGVILEVLRTLPDGEDEVELLLHRIRPGLLEIVRRRYPLLRDEAEDVVQEVLLKLADPVLRDRVRSSPAGLLATIMGNLAVDALRRTGRFHPNEGRVAAVREEVRWAIRDGVAPPAEVAAVERRDQVESLLRRAQGLVPESDLRLIVEHHGRGRPTRELAAWFGQSDAWVRTRISRGLRQMRRLFGASPG